ncbi:MAG: ABC transporter ATP-binding protein, partial [bacterium]|nr:ABC transporter ATP-binding protein [bacterium]
MSELIVAKGLVRSFGEIKAVTDVSFSASTGDVLGFLGPNGAGKSTTMRMLSSFLLPDSGEASICGYDVVQQSREARSRLGYLPESAPLYPDMTVKELLNFVLEVRQVGKHLRGQRFNDIVEKTHLDSVLQQRIETLSKGFKRRVGLAQALIHDPDVLILDEPTDGLDPNQKHDMRELIREMAKSKCILLSTHILEEVEEVCTRVIVISKGRIVVDETPDLMRRRSDSFGVVRLSFSAPLSEDNLTALRGIRQVDRVDVHSSAAGEVTYNLVPKNRQEVFSEVFSCLQNRS